MVERTRFGSERSQVRILSFRLDSGRRIGSTSFPYDVVHSVRSPQFSLPVVLLFGRSTSRRDGILRRGNLSTDRCERVGQSTGQSSPPASVTQSVECFPRKEDAAGSIPVGGSKVRCGLIIRSRMPVEGAGGQTRPEARQTPGGTLSREARGSCEIGTRKKVRS